MFSQEELEKKKIKNQAYYPLLHFVFSILPDKVDNNLIKSQHAFQKIDKKVIEKIKSGELSNEQMQELTSAYKQMKSIFEEILNK